MYVKGWMIFDILSLIGQFDCFRNKPLFIDFQHAVKNNNIEQEIAAVDKIDYYF
jgi:hypothetical protein